MDETTLKSILAGIVRHGLTTLGGMLVSAGYMQSSDTAGFIGGGMVVAGIVWSWWQKRGQALVADELSKLRSAKVITPASNVVKK